MTPAGRRKYGNILRHYIESARPIIDEHHWWLNTQVPQDVAFYRQIAASNPKFFRCINCPVTPSTRSCETIHTFFPTACDSDTIYIRFDDDIVWMAPDAVAELVRFRLKHPKPFLVFANTINNVICGHIHERMGAMFPSNHIGYDLNCPTGHGRWDIAVEVHKSFLKAIDENDIDRFKFHAWWFWGYEYTHINCISWFGGDIMSHGPVAPDEEHWLGHVAPSKTQRHNVICGTSLVSHFSYHDQMNEEGMAGVLMNYRNLAGV